MIRLPLDRDLESQFRRLAVRYPGLLSSRASCSEIHSLGILDDDPGVRPAEHVFVGEKALWFEITDDFPQHEKLPLGI